MSGTSVVRSTRLDSAREQAPRTAAACRYARQRFGSRSRKQLPKPPSGIMARTCVAALEKRSSSGASHLYSYSLFAYWLHVGSRVHEWSKDKAVRKGCTGGSRGRTPLRSSVGGHPSRPAACIYAPINS